MFLPDSEFLDIERPDFYTSKKYYGCGFKKMTELCNKKGYVLVATDLSSANAFYVKKEYADKFDKQDIEKMYNPPRYFLASYVPRNPF